MKKDKPKSSIKLLRDSIKENLVKELKEATGKFAPSKKLAKKIEKGSKELAKKIAKAVKPVEDTKLAPKAEIVVAEKIKPVKIKNVAETAEATTTEKTPKVIEPKVAKATKKAK
ncbi:MAG: hypothetical protein EOO87_15290 [Pedobacter sp.]|nr:MAG: hypothetical protein EOO87_15290 [Pedobacter sp.]